MTKLLYLQDSYMKEFEATVTKVDGNKIQLDKTCFYPLSGGQPGDTGTLVADGKEYKVTDTRKEAGKVIHEVDQEGIKEGDNITGIIDWSRRYKMMRSHTACHVLCHVVEKETKAKITGNQITDEKCRIDFNLEDFNREQIQSFEKQANQIIEEGVDINTKFLPREEAFQIPEIIKLKNVLPPAVKEIRIVDTDGYDVQACGGTHVKNTSEIKGIQITKIDNKGKNNRRVYFTLKD